MLGMSFPQSRFAYADMSKPEAWGVCDRCNFRYRRKDLVWQFDYRGLSLENLRILVCTRTCLDVANPQLKPIIVGPDPIPVKDPRPGFAATQMGTTPVFSPLELVDDDPISATPSPPAPPSLLGQWVGEEWVEREWD